MPARTTSSSPFEIPASIPPARLERRCQAGLDLVVGRRAALASEREAVADLDPLHRLDPHQRRREPRIEPVLAGGVRAEPGKDARGADLDDAAERVAVGPCGVDRLLPVLALAADLEHRAGDLDPELAQERLRDGAGRDEHGRMAGARPLERVAHVLVAVLEDTGEVGVAGAWQCHGLRALPGRLAVGRPRVHPPRPVLVVAVADDERERRSQRAPVPEPGEHLDLVLLELLARAAPVALLAAVQVGVDRGAVEREPGGQAGQDRHERRPVRLAGGGESERHAAERTAARMTSTGAGTPVQRSNDAAPCATSTSSPSTSSLPAARAAAAWAVSPPSAR